MHISSTPFALFALTTFATLVHALPPQGHSCRKPTASSKRPLEGQTVQDLPSIPTTTPLNALPSIPTITPLNALPSVDLATNASATGKKGAGLWSAVKIDTAVKEIGASWAYCWYFDPETAFTNISLTIPPDVELVPLVSTGLNTAANFATIKAKGYKTILGWNEPDLSPVTATEAANAWPEFVATGLRVGSPAPANHKLREGEWFYDFMNQIKALGSKVDFIALHHYAPEFETIDTAVDNFKKYLESVYEMYRLPIWVTEFAMVDYRDPGREYRTPDDATQSRYLTAACQMLESLEYIERYAWFALPQNNAQPPTNLFDPSGDITALGKAYKAV